MNESNKKKEDYFEKINEIGQTIRNNNLKKDKDVIQTTYGEIMEKLKENKCVSPPAPTVHISPWLSPEKKKNHFSFREPPSPHIVNVSPWLTTTIESDVHRPTIEFDDNKKINYK